MIRVVEEMGWVYGASSVVSSGGPERVVFDQPDPKFKPRPVGFTATLVLVEAEPLTWDGDSA